MPDDLNIPEGYVLVPREVYELLVDAARPVTITHHHVDPPDWLKDAKVRGRAMEDAERFNRQR